MSRPQKFAQPHVSINGCEILEKLKRHLTVRHHENHATHRQCTAQGTVQFQVSLYETGRRG